MPNFIKIGHIAILRLNLHKFLILGQIKELRISYLWLRNLTCSFGTKFFWNACFNVGCLLNFDFLGVYLVVTARYLVVTAGYFPLPGGLLLVTGGYCSLLLVPTFSMNGRKKQEHGGWKEPTQLRVTINFYKTLSSSPELSYGINNIYRSNLCNYQ